MKLFTYMTKPLVLFVLLFALGVGEMWGYWIVRPKVYFYNSEGWTPGILLLGHNANSQGFNFVEVPNTKLWYVHPDIDWHDLSEAHFGIVGNGVNNWEYNSESFTTRWGYVTKDYTEHTSKYDNLQWDNNDYKYITYINSTWTIASGNGAVPTYTAFLRTKVNENDGSGYSLVGNSTTWKASFNFTGTHWSGVDGETAQSTISNLQSNSWMDGNVEKFGYGNIPFSGKVRFVKQSINSAYELAGWGTEGDTEPIWYTDGSGNDVTFYVSKTGTNDYEGVYVAFIKRKQYTVTFDRKGVFGTSTVTATVDGTTATSGTLYNYGQEVVYTANPATGYEVEGWYSDAACTVSLNNGTASTYTVSSLEATSSAYVKFREKTFSVAFTNDGHGSVTLPTSTPQTVGQVTGIAINASEYFGYQFNTWTSSTGGSFDAAGTASTKFYPTAATTVTANFARRYAYIEANFQVYDATRSSRTPVGNVSWKDDSRAIEMAYDGTNRRYYLHTYSTPAQLAERLNDADAYFYIKTTSSSSSTFTDVVSYYAADISNQSLSAAGSANQKGVTTSSSANSFKFTGSDNGYVILYFDGTYVWYELEYGVTYDGNDNTGGIVPVDNDYYASEATVTVKADPDSWAKTGYTFGGWTTADGGSGTKYDAGETFAISDNTTLYAKWTQTVTLDKNGGSKDGSVDVIFHGTSTSYLSVAERAGYSVEAYYAEPGCTNKVLTDNGNLVGYSGYVEDSKWVHSNATTLYANWTAKNYTINLANMEATTAGTTSVSVTYNASTNMTSAITKPTKTHYTFDGYWTSENTGTTLDHQLIDANGNWIANVTGYTGNDGAGNPTWVHDYPISLYAKWIEKSHTVTVAVSAGAYDGTPGTVQISSDDVTEVIAGEVTWSPVMTPIANPGWKFKEWQKTSNIDFDDEHYHSDYQSSTTNSMVIKSYADNQTITAVFEPRYYLVGGELVGDDDDITTSGMPGWGNYDAPFIVTTSSPLLATCTCTLTNADKTYKILVRDKNDGISYGVNTYPFEVIQDGESLLFDDANCKVFLYAKGGTTFTFKITDVDASGHPYVSLDRPHQLHFGTGYAGIDNLSSVTNGTTGGTLAVTTSAGSLSNEDWVTYGTDVTYTPSAATGYTFEGFYTSNTYSSRFTQDNPWVHYNVTSDDNVYAKFVETSTSVTLANDGHGHVEIGGVTRTDTIVGITTHRKIVGVPDVGYKFSSWTKTSGSDYNIDDLSSDTATLSGNGGGATSGQTVTANFTYRWALKAESVGWGETQFIIENISTNASGDVVGYVEISLAANKNYQFTMKDLLTNDIYKNNNVAVQYMTYSTHENWDFATTYTYNCGITTAGKGTYRFTWNITHKTMTVTYPDSYQVNYGASPSVGGSITVVDDDSQAVPNGGYVRSGGNVTYTATPNDGYTFVGWCNDNSYGDPFTTYNPWPNNSVTATSNAYAKFKSTNFVIYRTGDMEDDPRAAYDDVESFDGGTISEVIELRMKVHELDKWYSLYLPYTVDSVCVYDVDEAKYYKMQPYFRKTLGGKLYAGHYIIRKPELTNDSIALSNFGDWRDPSSSTFTPSGNTPYIIQWHNSYFEGKYVSFFGAASQSIASSFLEGEAPKTKNWVTVHGNNSMKSGSVVDAYTLDGDEIWVRPVDKGKSVAILPFECYIRANSEVTNKYLVLRRGMNTDDTPTGWESVSIPSEKASKVLMDGQLYIIRGNQIYTIQGALVK